MQTLIPIPTKNEASQLLGQIARELIRKTAPDGPPFDYSPFIVKDKHAIVWPYTLQKLTANFHLLSEKAIETIGAINLYVQNCEEGAEVFNEVRFGIGLMQNFGSKKLWPTN